MKVLGIVGSEDAKFTDETRQRAISEIRGLILRHRPTCLVSGACHLGGVDQWAAREGRLHGVRVVEYPPAVRRWSGGYMERNIQIAKESDIVVCITVKELPPDYKGMRFRMCYHCGTDSHVKSGGCWTMKYAEKLGKETQLIVV
jgi:hypothetical protein